MIATYPRYKSISTMIKLLYFTLIVILSQVNGSIAKFPRNATLTIVTAVWQNNPQTWESLESTVKFINQTTHQLIICTKPELIGKATRVLRVMGFKTKPVIFEIKPETFSMFRKWISFHFDETSDYKIDYLRMFILREASFFDPYNSDQLVWLDLSFAKNATISSFIKNRGLQSMLKKAKYHFFFMSMERQNYFQFSNVQQTYFNTSMEHYASNIFFGGKKESIDTICTIYQDLMKVVLYYDKNSWSELELLSLLAQRSPYLISLLQIISSEPKNIPLKSSNKQIFSNQKFEYLSYAFKLLNIVGVGLILYEVFKILKKSKQAKQAKKQLRPISQTYSDVDDTSVMSNRS